MKSTKNVVVQSNVEAESEIAERIPVLGIAATRCVRGLSAAGFTLNDCRAICRASGALLSDRLIASQHRYGRMIVLTEEQKTQARAIVAQASAVAAKAKAAADRVAADAAKAAAKAAKVSKKQVEAIAEPVAA